MPKTSKPSIFVCGDVAVDWIDSPRPPLCSHGEPGLQVQFPNWKLYPGIRRRSIHGGAWILTRMLRAMVGDTADVHGPAEVKLDQMETATCVQSYMRADRFKTSDGRKNGWRVTEIQGFDGPDDPDRGLVALYTDALEHFSKPKALHLLVVDDSGNGLRQSKQLADQLSSLVGTKTRAVVYKLFRPLDNNCGQNICDPSGLWQRLHAACRKKKIPLVAIVDINDLRAEDAAIGRGLSWERTCWEAMQCLQQKRNGSRFTEPDKIPSCWLLVRMDLESVLILPPGALDTLAPENGKKRSRPGASLVYDPLRAEGDYDEQIAGTMVGRTSVFTAAVCHTLVKATEAKPGIAADGPLFLQTMQSASKSGLGAMRSLLDLGFHGEQAAVNYPYETIARDVASGSSAKSYLTASVPPPTATFGWQDNCWSVVSSLGLRKIEALSRQIVLKGIDVIEDQIPMARYGKLTAVTLSEIESYRSIQRLIREYRDAGVQDRPLCIGVFGRPGSGKSFGVKQVVRHILGDAVDTLTFNLSEFNDVAELARAFHLVHDKTRDGKMPLVFFDEFDASHHGKSLAWLKYFLAPMQDGLFNDGADIHPLGRAIFVFAGGTKHSYQAFADQSLDPDFIETKGPDFLSRLRGFIDIMGTDPAHEQDYSCLLRRAVMLRIFLEGRAKTLGQGSHWLLDADRRIHIDLGVLRGFLKVPKYYNGARSMTSLVEVSTLSSGQGFSRASLPSKQIVDMYAPSHEFFQLVNLTEDQEPLFLPSREILARLVHEQYCRRNPSSDTAVPWDQLAEGLREQNRQQVNHYMTHLKAIGCDVELSELADQPHQLTKKDIEGLAKLEHERWCRIKRLQGWRCGKKKDEQAMTHPDLIEWEELCRKRPKEVPKDIDAMADIPMMLKEVGLSIIKVPQR